MWLCHYSCLAETRWLILSPERYKPVSIVNVPAALGQWKYFTLCIAYVTWRPGKLSFFLSPLYILPSFHTPRAPALYTAPHNQIGKSCWLMLLTQLGEPASLIYPGFSILQSEAPKRQTILSLAQKAFLCSITWNVSFPDRNRDWQERVNESESPPITWVKIRRKKGSKRY